MGKSKAQIMVELDSLQVAYDSKQSYKELVGLLKTKQKGKAPVQASPERAQPAEAKQVRCGLATIQDHEERITALEAKQKK